MECTVCYTSNSNCKLVCGHAFCLECVKKWYHKGTNDGCPMCRRKLYFKRMPIKKWAKEARDDKMLSVFQDVFDETIKCILEDEDDAPSWFVMDELTMLEKTFNVLKVEEEITPEDLEYLLGESGDYFSDRKLVPKNKLNNFYGDVFAHEKKQRWDFKKNNSKFNNSRTRR